MKPRPFEGRSPLFPRGTLVTDGQNRVGYLRETESLQPMFHPLELTPAQRTKASMYIEIRDAYYHLYNNEAETLTANPPCGRCSTGFTTISPNASDGSMTNATST